MGTPASISDSDAAAHRGHRRAAVGLEDLRDDPQGVGEVLLRRQHPGQRPLGQVAVADLAPAGPAQRLGLAGRERREVVVEHEALLDLVGQPLDVLRVLLGAQRGGHQRLGLTAGEQRRAVGAGQHPDLAGDLPDVGGGPAVDAPAGVQHQLAQVLLLGRLEGLLQLGIALGELGLQRRRWPRCRRRPARRSAPACPGWPWRPRCWAFGRGAHRARR